MSKKDLETKALEAVAAYLKSIGWHVVVGGFGHIETRGSLKYNFALTLILLVRNFPPLPNKESE